MKRLSQRQALAYMLTVFSPPWQEEERTPKWLERWETLKAWYCPECFNLEAIKAGVLMDARRALNGPRNRAAAQRRAARRAIDAIVSTPKD